MIIGMHTHLGNILYPGGGNISQGSVYVSLGKTKINRFFSGPNGHGGLGFCHAADDFSFADDK